MNKFEKDLILALLESVLDRELITKETHKKAINNLLSSSLHISSKYDIIYNKGKENCGR